MAYLGRTPAVGSFQKIDSIFGLQNNSRQTFPLLISSDPFTPESVFQIEVIKNGYVLEPGIEFSTSSTTISFPVAPTTTDNIWIMVYGTALFTGIPSADSITNEKIVDSTIGYNKLSGDAVGTIIGDILTFGI